MNLTNVVTILQIIPFVIDIMRKVEESIPPVDENGEKNGPAKLQAVKTILDTVLDNADELWPTLENVIAGIVKVFNVVGTFKK